MKSNKKRQLNLLDILWDAGKPVIFLAVLCLGLGTFFLTLDAVTGYVLILTAVAVVALFFILATLMDHHFSDNHWSQHH